MEMSKVTYLSEVYDYFLSSISDYTLLEDTPENIENDLFTYFKKARSRFYKCKQSLDLKEDVDGESYFFAVDDKTNEEVSVKLTGFELAIISHLMLVEYMRPQVVATEVMKQSLSDKDFKIYSQANQLRELQLLYRQIQKESKTMITEYTYIGMTKNDK